MGSNIDLAGRESNESRGKKGYGKVREKRKGKWKGEVWSRHQCPFHIIHMLLKNKSCISSNSWSYF